MIKKVYTLSMKSRKSLNKVEDFLGTVRLHCRMLPEYTPMKFDWTEPIKQVFNPDDLSKLVFKNGKVDNVWWKRTDNPKANGNWMRSGIRSGDTSNFTHSDISLNVLDTSLQQKLIDYLKASSIQCEVDIGFIDSVADEYKPAAILNGYAPYGGDLRLSTKQLRNWLPEMPWATVFGPTYIKMFGKEKVLATPGYIVEEFENDFIFIQLTPSMEDIHTDYQLVTLLRLQAKEHLGNEYFFDPEVAYNINSNPEKAGKVFKVPVFDMILD